MTHLNLKTITQCRFRANSDYQLVAFQSLPDKTQAALGELRQDEDFYGFLYPVAAKGNKKSLGVKSVCQQTARLYRLLSEPRCLPTELLDALAPAANKAIAQLVLDGLLEIEVGARFICSSAAHSAIYIEQTAETTLNKTTQLSQSALKYAQSLNLRESAELSSRLYSYNCVPESAYWRDRLPNPTAVERYLGIQTGNELHTVLQTHWHQHLPEHDGETAYKAWLMWSSRRALTQSPQVLTHKLYISPTCAALPESFGKIVAAFTELAVPHFKVGKDRYGLLRADKMVAYFPSYAAIQAAEKALSVVLKDVPAQGVPFTAGLDERGLLSWGMDPPKSANSLPWQGRESWRLWLTNQLAVSLQSAQGLLGEGAQPWQFACDRLRLEGVDPSTWIPDSSVFTDR